MAENQDWRGFWGGFRTDGSLFGGRSESGRAPRCYKKLAIGMGILAQLELGTVGLRQEWGARGPRYRGQAFSKKSNIATPSVSSPLLKCAMMDTWLWSTIVMWRGATPRALAISSAISKL